MKDVVDFSQGKQNEDVDERFVEKGSYVELVNGRVLDSVGSHAGCITSLKGTEAKIKELLQTKYNFKPIAVTPFEDYLYLFLAHEEKGNVIVRYNVDTLVRNVVFVDANIDCFKDAELFAYLIVGTATPATIPFAKLTNIKADADVHMIVYENMLYFHDRDNDPYKINIERSIADLHHYMDPTAITVVKAPPLLPLISICSSSSQKAKTFNESNIQFASSYEYEDGEVSAVSDYTNMPFDVESDSTDSFVTDGNSLEIPNDGDVVFTKRVINNGYTLKMYVTKISKIVQSSEETKIIYGHKLQFKFFDDKDNSLTGSDFIKFTYATTSEEESHAYGDTVSDISYYFNQTALFEPIITSFSVSRKEHGDNMFAFTISYDKNAVSPDFDPIRVSGGCAIIYDEASNEGYIFDNTRRRFASTLVTANKSVFVAGYTINDRRYRLYKLTQDGLAKTKILRGIVGTSYDTNTNHAISKSNVIASDYSGTIIYFVTATKSKTNLFVSSNGGATSSFKQIGTKEVMFADTLNYIKEFNSKDQNRWSVSVCCSSDGNIIYVGCCGCIAVSKDGGDHWESNPIDSSISSNGAILDVKCSVDGKTVFTIMGCSDSEDNDNKIPQYTGEVYKSYNYGKTFENADVDYENNVKLFQITQGLNVSSVEWGSRSRKLYINEEADTIFTDALLWYSLVYADGSKYTTYPKGRPRAANVTMMSVDGGVVYTPINYQYDLLSDAVREAFNSQSISFIAQGLIHNDVRNISIYNNATSLKIDYHTGDKHVKKINLLMRKNGHLFTIKEILRSDVNTFDNDTIATYEFDNSGSYKALQNKDADKLFDNVPTKVLSSDIIQNALMFGGYTDGKDNPSVAGIEASIVNVEAQNGQTSLKTGQSYRYGLVFYDNYNRSSSVCEINSISTDRMCADAAKTGRVAQIAIPTTYKAPTWAKKFKFVRSAMNNRFYCINGFSNAKTYQDVILLDITSLTDIVPSVGDTLELVYDFKSKSGERDVILQVIGYIDNKSGIYEGSVDSDYDIVGDGRFIVVANNDEEGLSYESVLSETSIYTNSYWYLNHLEEPTSDDSFFEIPYSFEIDSTGLLLGEIHDELRDTPIYADGIYTLYDDGDVVLMTEPNRELSTFQNYKRYSTLGRPNLKIDNYKCENRTASICVSEPYVQDTGYNGLSSFNTTLINFKDLDKRYGTIEAVKALQDSIVIFQTYRCSRLQYRKNLLSTADNNSLVSKSQDIFGEQQFYAEEYGLTNRHSLASWGNSYYFADNNRGKVLRLGINGINVISDYGMRQHFFNSLAGYKGDILSCYDPQHESYMLFHNVDSEMMCDNFYEPINGWSGKFKITPDVITNTHSGTYSMKNGVLYKHDVLEEPFIYGEIRECTMKIAFNSNANIIKTFNAIQIEVNKAPYFISFTTDSGYCILGTSNFERREMQYVAPIPMAQGLSNSTPIFCGVAIKDYEGASVVIPLAEDTFGIHSGDAVYVGVLNESGECEVVGETYTILSVSPQSIEVSGVSTDVAISKGDYIFASDTSQINGYTQKGKSMNLELKFSGKTLVKSIILDIDESKI